MDYRDFEVLKLTLEELNAIEEKMAAQGTTSYLASVAAYAQWKKLAWGVVDLGITPEILRDLLEEDDTPRFTIPGDASYG